MEVYSTLFLINLLLSFFADKFFNKKRIFSFILIVLLISVNVIISGFRDFGIGVDTNFYINDYFIQAQNLISISDLFDSQYDIGYLLLAYLSSFFSNDSQSLLFFTALWIQIFICLAFWQLKKNENVSIFFSVVFFYIVFYAHTLNMMRQSCALALLAYAFSLFIQGKWGKYSVLQIIAFFFHSSSIMFVFVPIIWHLSKMENLFKRNLIFSLAIIFVGVFVFFYFSILPLLGNLNLVSNVYVDRYGASGDFLNNGESGIGLVLSSFFSLSFIFYAISFRTVKSNILCFLLVLSVFNFLLQFLGLKVIFMYRLAFYFSVILFMFIPLLFSSMRISFLVKIIVFLIYLSMSCRSIYICGDDGIYPYKSKILNIN